MALTAVSYVLYSKTTAVTRRVYRNLLTANAAQYAGDPRYERPTGPRVCPRLARVEPVESQEWQLTGPCLQYAQFDSRRMQASLFFVVLLAMVRRDFAPLDGANGAETFVTTRELTLTTRTT